MGLIDQFEGLGEEMADELAGVNAATDAYAARQMAAQRLAAVLPMVKAEARELGLEFD